MHYIYIHRYTINYNKVREAHRISPRFHSYLDKILYLSNNSLVNFLACFCNICYNTELGGLFFLTKIFKVETLSVLLATQGDRKRMTFVAVEEMEWREDKDGTVHRMFQDCLQSEVREHICFLDAVYNEYVKYGGPLIQPIDAKW